jgi:hypothetical protein
MYIICTTRVQHPSHMGWAPHIMGPTPCERGVVHLLYMWCTGITSIYIYDKVIHALSTKLSI